MSNEIKTWHERCDWLSNRPAPALMVEAMKAEIAELRAALAATQAPSAPVAPIDERSAFQRAMNAARFFPRELDFSMTKSPSGKRDEYVNTHLESCWNGWQARAALSVQAGTRAIVIKGDEYLVTFKPDDEVEVVWKGPYLAAPTPPTTGEA